MSEERNVHNALNDLYEEYFLDYASYVILERAVPTIEDGCKPVHRRILHSMKVMDDGRYHKVANIIGHTMQYHPHGDAAIGDALVGLGQKNLLIDCQGNWGDNRTGDSAAAPRYIEARLTKFALEVAFNHQTTEWQLTYDGRKNEPIHLPLKFPLLLAQGVEGIAVGLSTKILPHNFIELLRASIKVLEGKRFSLFPDFDTGGYVDITEYNDGKRGGKVKCRAKIEILDKNTLAIKELPYGVTTNNLIDSIIKANDKGKIKIKKLRDNTAKNVEILVDLSTGTSPEVAMDALFAFTNCEVSISPNACVIIDKKPHFLTVSEILKINVENTKNLLRWELEIRKAELEEKWHFSSLEKIFIEKRIYRDIEECETWEAVLEAIRVGLEKYVATPNSHNSRSNKRLLLKRDITEEDVVKLTEIKIKRISKYNSFKADELIQNIEKELEDVKNKLSNLVQYTIDWYQHLLDKYGEGRERKTEIKEFETINTRRVVANNAKLYVDRKEGFFGTSLKKEEFVCECSDIDDVIVFRKDGKFGVYPMSDKVFVGKDIIHLDIWKKNDERTTYNLFYLDGMSGKTMGKRFNVKAITRNKEYDLTKGSAKSKVIYFSANPNGETELVNVQLTPGCKAKKKIIEYDFAQLAIKGRGSQGNTITKYPIKKVTQIEQGTSSLGAQKYWLDEVSGRINREERGLMLGMFDSGENLIYFLKNGEYQVKEIQIDLKLPVDSMRLCAKLEEEKIFNAIYYDGEKKNTMVKRFKIETTTLDTSFPIIPAHKTSELLYIVEGNNESVSYKYKRKKETKEEVLDFDTFIEVKGWKALGNKLVDAKVYKLESSTPNIKIEEEKDIRQPTSEKQPYQAIPKDLFGYIPETKNQKKNDDLDYGDTVDLDF